MQQMLFAGNQNSVINSQREFPFDVIELNEGDVLFREGDTPKGLYYVNTGCVKMVVNRQLSRGRTTSPDYVTKLVSPGEYFGYKALVRNGPQRGSATAVTRSTVWVYPREFVQVALKNANPLVSYLLAQAASDLETYENVNQLHYLASVQERIAYQLVVLAEKFGVPTADGVVLNLKLTRNELAQLASTINESLSRHLTEFKTEGLVDVNGKEILIKDLAGLKRKSGNFR